MNRADAFAVLLARVAASGGEPAMLSEQELAEWPAAAVARLKSEGLLVKGPPAEMVVCPGCEEVCAMPVEVATTLSGKLRAFVVCDKRDDAAHISIPGDLLEQWTCSPERVADVLARLLGTRRSDSIELGRRWDVGVLRGAKHSAHVVLGIGDALQLEIAGHMLALADVLQFGAQGLAVDRRALLRCVDAPVAGAGSAESAEQRRERLRARIGQLKASGVKAFLKTLAAEEGLSETRIKQLLKDTPEPAVPAGIWSDLLLAAKGASLKKRKTKA